MNSCTQLPRPPSVYLSKKLPSMVFNFAANNIKASPSSGFFFRTIIYTSQAMLNTHTIPVRIDTSKYVYCTIKVANEIRNDASAKQVMILLFVFEFLIARSPKAQYHRPSGKRPRALQLTMMLAWGKQNPSIPFYKWAAEAQAEK